MLDQVRTGSILLGVRGAGVVEGVEPEEIRVETPFLQLVMSRLWQEERARGSRTLRLATLNALGGAEQIVRAHLAGAMSALKRR